jgi:gas vesicle protein
MLLAPKSGSELRGQLSESASTIGRAASDQYQKAAGVAGNLAEKGRQISRDVMGRQKEAVPRVPDEATPSAPHNASGPTRS